MSDKKEEKKETATTDRLATVVDFFESGAAKVRFDGEDKDSEKEYPFMKHCIPTKGDRVYMRAFAESYIIEGVILFETAPQKLDGVDSDFNVKGKLKASSAEISGNVSASNINGDVTGNVTGNVRGSLTGNVRGNVTGDVTGNVRGTLTGNVKGGGITASNITASGTVSCSAMSANYINCSNFKTSSSGIGFFGYSPSRKEQVYSLPSSPDIKSVTTTINSLLYALRKYGLIS